MNARTFNKIAEGLQEAVNWVRTMTDEEFYASTDAELAAAVEARRLRLSLTRSPTRSGVTQNKGGQSGDARQEDLNMSSIAKNHPDAKVKSLFMAAHQSENVRLGSWLNDTIKRSQLLPADQFIHEVVQMTPEFAGIILEDCNVENRRFKPNRIAAYAKAMAEGRWQLHTQGISFARDGKLNNGQNRLMAVVRSGCTVPMSLAFGEDRSVFVVLDTGAVRGGSDTLQIAGRKNTALLAASARLLMMVENGAAFANATFPNDVLEQWVSTRQDLDLYVTAGHSVGNKLKASPSGIVCGLYIIAMQSKIPMQPAHFADGKITPLLGQFIDRITDGTSGEPRCPTIALRDALMKGEITKKAHPGIRGNLISAAVINTWSRWARKRTGSSGKIMWQPGQPFPQPE